MIIFNQSPSRLHMLQGQKSLKRHWLSCSGCGKECASLDFSYKGSQFIRKGQWCAKVIILRLTVVYLNVTINSKTRNTEPEIWPDGSSQWLQISLVDRYGSGFSLPRRCVSGFWMVLEPNSIIFPVQTWTAAGLPGPVTNTNRRKGGPRHWWGFCFWDRSILRIPPLLGVLL
jgi:hypothetical protein